MLLRLKTCVTASCWDASGKEKRTKKAEKLLSNLAAQVAPPKVPSAFQSAASLPSFAARAIAEPSALPGTSSAGSAGGHVDVTRTGSVPAQPLGARVLSDHVIFEERISLGAAARRCNRNARIA